MSLFQKSVSSKPKKLAFLYKSLVRPKPRSRRLPKGRFVQNQECGIPLRKSSSSKSKKPAFTERPFHPKPRTRRSSTKVKPKKLTFFIQFESPIHPKPRSRCSCNKKKPKKRQSFKRKKKKKVSLETFLKKKKKNNNKKITKNYFGLGGFFYSIF